MSLTSVAYWMRSGSTHICNASCQQHVHHRLHSSPLVVVNYSVVLSFVLWFLREPLTLTSHRECYSIYELNFRFTDQEFMIHDSKKWFMVHRRSMIQQHDLWNHESWLPKQPSVVQSLLRFTWPIQSKSMGAWLGRRLHCIGTCTSLCSVFHIPIPIFCEQLLLRACCGMSFMIWYGPIWYFTCYCVACCCSCRDVDVSKVMRSPQPARYRWPSQSSSWCASKPTAKQSCSLQHRW